MTERPTRSLFDKFAYVERRLGELGLPIKPGSRLQKERALLTGSDGSPRSVELEDPAFRDALEALRDYTLFERILESPLCGRPDRLVLEKMKDALRDHVDPYVGSRSVGRDSELELFVAAELAYGGVPVTFVRTDPALRTPDVRARLDGRFFYVEVKRPKSKTSLLECVEDAVDQLLPTGCPGAVFIETSLAFNAEGGLVTRPMSDAEFRALYSQGLRLNIKPFESALRRLLATAPIGGIAFQDHTSVKASFALVARKGLAVVASNTWRILAPLSGAFGVGVMSKHQGYAALRFSSPSTTSGHTSSPKST